MQLLTDHIIKKLPAPKKGLVIYRDEKVRGLGVRVLPSGTKAFVLDYTPPGGQRRVFTIGQCAGWTIAAARSEATDWQSRVRNGEDPAEDLRKRREARSVKDLCDDFTETELPKLRPATRRDYARLIKNDIGPKIGNLKVLAVTTDDIRKIHTAITKRGSPFAANGCVVLCKRLFNFAKVQDNPAKGITPNPTEPRERYLKDTEIASLSKALDAYEDQDVADIFRLLMLTGARRGETQSATWEQFDLTPKAAVWTKPSSHTKQKKIHRVPLSPPALAMLAKRRTKADSKVKKLKAEVAKAKETERDALRERMRRVETFVFPARTGDQGHVWEIKKAWASLCRTAGIKKCRIHDLRHTAASVLVSLGMSLVMVGKLLGHTQASTTQRYAHLFDEAQRATADMLGAAITKAAKKGK